MNQFYLLALLWACLALSCTSAWEVSQQQPGSSPNNSLYANNPNTPANQQQAVQGKQTPQESESFFDFISENPNSAQANNQTQFQQQATAPNNTAAAAVTPSAQYRQASTQASIPAVLSDGQLIAVDRSILMQWKQSLDAILEETGTPQTAPVAPSRSPSAPIQAVATQTQPMDANLTVGQTNPTQPARTSQTQMAVQDSWDDLADPNDLMFQEMEQRMEPQQRPSAARRPSAQAKQAPIAQPAANPPTPRGMIPVQINPNRRVFLNEKMLVEWENELIASRRGRQAEVALPTWLLQGLEWLTDAPSEEPERSQVIMPLYRYMQKHNFFHDVNQNNMTPGQIVAKLRLLVEDAKFQNGTLLQGP